MSDILIVFCVFIFGALFMAAMLYGGLYVDFLAHKIRKNDKFRDYLKW